MQVGTPKFQIGDLSDSKAVANLRQQVRQLDQKVEQAHEAVTKSHDAFKAREKELDREIHRDFVRMHRYPKIKAYIPFATVGAVSLGFGALGALPSALGSPIGLAVTGGVALLAAGAAIGGIALNEHVKKELAPVPSTFAGVAYAPPQVERDYHRALQEKDELSSTTGMGPALDRYMALGNELKSAKQKLSKLQAVPADVLKLVNTSVDHWQAEVKDMGDAVSIGGISVDKQDD